LTEPPLAARVSGQGATTQARYGSGLSFRDLDNIALEFFIAPGT
jgi:hypothetical protein